MTAKKSCDSEKKSLLSDSEIRYHQNFLSPTSMEFMIAILVTFVQKFLKQNLFFITQTPTKFGYWTLGKNP